MADDKTENTQEPETPQEETPAAEVEETPAAEVEETPAAEVEETPAAEVEAPAEDIPADEPAPAVAGPSPSSGKERKIQARVRRGKRRISDPQERAADRKAKAAARSRHRAKAREKAKAKRAASPAEVTPPRDHGPGRAKVRQGTVVSDKADKTITVRIDTARRHRRYEKIVRSSSTLHAHDETNEAHAGDVVTIVECRPLSRLKRWKLVEVLERAK